MQAPNIASSCSSSLIYAPAENLHHQGHHMRQTPTTVHNAHHIDNSIIGVWPYRPQTITATARWYWPQPKTIPATQKIHLSQRPYRPQHTWWVKL